MTNYHCHSIYCDGVNATEEMVQAAIAEGLSALGLSSHAPVPFETSWIMPGGKHKDYITDIRRLKEKYANDIQIYQGLEVDYIKGETDAKTAHIQSFDSDYLIGSIHFLGQLMVDGERWTVDGSQQEFQSGLDEMYGGDIRRLVRDFTEQSVAMMELGGFDIVGHMDKIYQHGHTYFSLDEAWYQDEMMTLLEMAKAKDYVVEINTKHYHLLGFFFPHQAFFKNIKDLKIPVQVNSDCHQKEMMTAAYKMAYDCLKSAGIEEERVLFDGKWQDRAIET